jgi:hypothetical protein
MDIYADNLKKLLDSIRSIGFWGRLFRWKEIRSLLYDAFTDTQKLCSGIDTYKDQLAKSEIKATELARDYLYANQVNAQNGSEIEQLKDSIRQKADYIRQLEMDRSAVNSTIKAQQDKIRTLEIERNEFQQQAKYVTNEFNTIKDLNTKLLKDDEFRKNEHSNAMSTLKNFQMQVQQDRQREIEERNKAEQDRLRKLKETWSNHQENVRNTIKSICSRHIIEYIEKVPFKGEPDNTLNICDEFIVFDAKSPGGDDYSNFPIYLKDQAERAKKYCKEENVKKEIYFVVPANTLPILKQTVYKLADYTVYVVSLETLEPIILSLQRLEEYEFVEQLSPEERENICRVLGKFAHLTKRRIQIDTFFTKQFMELAYKCEADLPPEILQKVIEYEKAEKLNPPTERRSKQINLKELDKDVSKLRNETNTKGIAAIESIISTELNKMPLYTDDSIENVN